MQRWKSPRRSRSTPSNRTSRRVACVTCAIASPTTGTFGTTVHSPKSVHTFHPASSAAITHSHTAHLLISPLNASHCSLCIFFISQTWEDPTQQHSETKANGDNDPLDVCEIGEQVGYVGQVKQVKVLGIMALLDEGETDWKVLVVDVQDPLASKLNDIEDVERHLPGLVRATSEWFRCVVFLLLISNAFGPSEFLSTSLQQHLQNPRRQAREPIRLLWRGQK